MLSYILLFLKTNDSMEYYSKAEAKIYSRWDMKYILLVIYTIIQKQRNTISDII